jgi:hypothetical protein
MVMSAEVILRLLGTPGNGLVLRGGATSGHGYSHTVWKT